MINIKEEFLSSVKTKRAYKLGGSAAIHLWLCLKAYVCESNSGGFVPVSVIDDLPLIPRGWKGKPLKALIECGKPQRDGKLGPGLVETTEHGLELHDYEDHGTPQEVEDERRRKAREQKRQRRAALRRSTGQGSGLSGGHDRTDPPDKGADCPADITPDNAPDRPPRPGGHGHAPARAPAGSPAQPSPAQPRSNPPGDPSLSGQGNVDPPDPGGRVTCPPDLQLTEAQLANLEMAGVKPAAAKQIAGWLVSKWVVDTTKRMTPERWAQYLASAVRSTWSDPEMRPKEPEDEADAGPTDYGPDVAERLRLTRDKREREARERTASSKPRADDGQPTGAVITNLAEALTKP